MFKKITVESMNAKNIIKIIVILTSILLVSFLSRGLSDTVRFLLIVLATFLSLNIVGFNKKK